MSVGYGTVTADFGALVPQGPSGPLGAASGTVTFTPNVPSLIDQSGKEILGAVTIVGYVNSAGVLCQDQAASKPGVPLVATDSDLATTGWVYNVRYNISVAGSPVALQPHTLALATGQSLDLSAVVPPPAAPLASVGQAAAALAGAVAAESSAQASAAQAQASAGSAAAASSAVSADASNAATSASAAAASASSAATSAANAAASATNAQAHALIVVDSGSNGSTARPAGAAAVYWIGLAQPANAVDGDLWMAI